MENENVSYGELVKGVRLFADSLGDYVEGSEAQKNHIGFWLPRFVAEFKKHGVDMEDI